MYWLTVTTVTIPTPIRPTLTCLCPSRVIWITPEHPMPNPNPLTLSHLNNALPNTPTPLRLVNAFPGRRTFDFSSPSRQVDSRHPHSFPTRCSFNLYSSLCQVDSRPDAHSTFTLPHIKSIPNIHTHSWPDVASVSQLQSGKARSHTSLAWCVLVRLSLLPIYMFLYVPLSHHSLPSAHFLCLILSSPSPSTLVSSIFTPYLHRPYFTYSVHSLRPIPDHSDHPDHYHTLHLYKYTKYKLL